MKFKKTAGHFLIATLMVFSTSCQNAAQIDVTENDPNLNETQKIAIDNLSSAKISLEPVGETCASVVEFLRAKWKQDFTTFWENSYHCNEYYDYYSDGPTPNSSDDSGTGGDSADMSGSTSAGDESAVDQSEETQYTEQNSQVKGVGEFNNYGTNGKFAFYLTSSSLSLYRVDDFEKITLLKTIQQNEILPSQSQEFFFQKAAFYQNHIIVLATKYGVNNSSSSALVKIDLADNASDIQISAIKNGGDATTLKDARIKGNKMYSVIEKSITMPFSYYPTSYPQMCDGRQFSTAFKEALTQYEQELFAQIDSYSLADYLPKITVTNAQGDLLAERQLACDDFYKTPYNTLSALTIALVDDLDQFDKTAGEVVKGVFTQTSLFYMSTNSLILISPTDQDQIRFTTNNQLITASLLHVFDLTSENDPLLYNGSVAIPGEVNDQWQVNQDTQNTQQAGVIHVVSEIFWGSKIDSNCFDGNCENDTSDADEIMVMPPIDTFGNPDEIRLFSIGRDGENKLSVIGQTPSLISGESVFGVRFLNSLQKAFVVTYEVMMGDPLFHIDLTDSTNPQVLNGLEMPGYLSYIHEVTVDNQSLLFGLGYAGDCDDWGCFLTGDIQLGLFDFSNDTATKRLDYQTIAGYSSAVENHLDFTYDDNTNQFFLQYNTYSYNDYSYKPFVDVYQIGTSDISLLKTIPINASVLPSILGSVLFSNAEQRAILVIGEGGMAFYDVTTGALLSNASE